MFVYTKTKVQRLAIPSSSITQGLAGPRQRGATWVDQPPLAGERDGRTETSAPRLGPTRHHSRAPMRLAVPGHPSDAELLDGERHDPSLVTAGVEACCGGPGIQPYDRHDRSF